jgi:hypothetical protein
MTPNMAIVLVFVLGIGNFALHRAVLDSRHPLLTQMPQLDAGSLGRITLAIEFAILCGALLLVAYGHRGWSLAYLGYSALNGLAGWLILTRRI